MNFAAFIPYQPRFKKKKQESELDFIVGIIIFISRPHDKGI